MLFFFTFTCFNNVILRVDIYLFNISFDNIFSRWHFNIHRNIDIFRNVMHDWNFYSNISKFRNLKCSIIRFSLCILIGYRSIVFYRSISINRFWILEIDFKMFSSKLRFDSVLFVNILSWNKFFLNNSVFVNFNW